MVCDGKGVMKLLTSDDAATREKLDELGLPYMEQEILTVTMPDRPGQLGDFAEMIAGAGINIETIFVIDTASGFTELAIGVDKLEEAKSLPLGQF